MAVVSAALGLATVMAALSITEAQLVNTKCGPVMYESPTSLLCCMCQGDRASWYEETFGEADLTGGNQTWLFQKNVKSWDQVCSWGYAVGSCMKDGVAGCQSDIADEILSMPPYPAYVATFNQSLCGSCGADGQFVTSWRILGAFYSQVCHNGMLKTDVQQAVTSPEFDETFRCVDDRVRIAVFRCWESLAVAENSLLLEFRDRSRTIEDIQKLTSRRSKLYSGALQCAYIILNRSTCDATTRTVLYKVDGAQPRSTTSAEFDNTNVDQSVEEDVRSVLRCTVSVYGNSHLKTCWSKPLVTCNQTGSQIFVRNKYFSVEGTNEAVSSSSTPLKSVSIRFYSADGVRAAATYSATDGELPRVFDNPSDGADGSGDVEIRADPSGMVVFLQRSSGAAILLGQFNASYFFTVRAATNVLVSSSGLVVDGCPPDNVVVDIDIPTQNIDVSTTIQCVHNLCRSVVPFGTSGEFLQSCAFDCIATGSAFAENMTSGALGNERRAVTYDGELTSLAKKNNSGQSVRTQLVSVLLFSLLAMFPMYNFMQ